MTTEYKTIADLMSATDNNIGVPIEGCGEGILQPHVKYKFKIKFTGPLGECYLVPRNNISCSRPSLTFDETKTAIGNGDHIFTIGQHSWLPQKISFIDKADSFAHTFINRQLQLQNEAFMGGKQIEYKFDVNITMLNPDDTIVEAWDLTNCFLQEVNYPSLSTSDEVEMELIIRCDLAQML